MRNIFTICAAAAILALGAHAEAVANERVPTNAAVTAQKSAFLERLVTDSVSARTIMDSGDDAAIAKLEEARRLVEEAKALLSEGDFALADKKLDQAIDLVNGEARRLSVSEIKTSRAAEAFERRRHTVEIFLSAYERVTEDEKDSAAGTQAALIRKLVAEANVHKARGEFEKGVAILDRAYEIARSDIRDAREGQTLVRSLEFETPQEAYEYELGRARSHFLLLQFAIEEKNPQGSILDAVKEKQTQAEALRTQALKKAGDGQYIAAISDLEAATEQLLKGIRMAGIFIPG
jgi:tetratricopeptide (TPR) repeat protein